MTTTALHAFASDSDAQRAADLGVKSARQFQVYEAIRVHVAEHGFAPTLREIGELVGLKSPSSVKHQLHSLEELGLLRINAGKGRAIELIEPESSSTSPDATTTKQEDQKNNVPTAKATVYPFP